MKAFVIAEFGLCHDGTVESAKEVIRAAQDCGASAVKGQAFKYADVKGSMPSGFYKERCFNPIQCLELIQYGNQLGITVFFSIFSKGYECVTGAQRLHKFAAGQSKKQPRLVEKNDHHDVIVSVNAGTHLPILQNASVLYASPYLATDPQLDCITFLSEFYKRQVGYSDHTIGIEWCKLAVKKYGCNMIEKHFTLTRDIYFEGKQFSDAVHGATPKELSALIKAVG